MPIRTNSLDPWLVEAVEIANVLLEHDYFLRRNEAIEDDLEYLLGTVRIRFKKTQKDVCGWTPAGQARWIVVNKSLALRVGNVRQGTPEYLRLVLLIGATIFHEVNHLAFTWRNGIGVEEDSEEGTLAEDAIFGGVIMASVNGVQSIIGLDRNTPVTGLRIESGVRDRPIFDRHLQAFFNNPQRYDVQQLPLLRPRGHAADDVNR